MRPLEELMLLAAVATLPVLARSGAARAGGAAIVATVLLYLVREGWRPAAMPVVLGALLVAVLAFRSRRRRPRRPFPAAGAGLASLLLLAGTAWSIARPLRALPAPNGPDGVGTTEIASAPSPFSPRLFVWYPAAPGATGIDAPYRRTPRVGPRRFALLPTASRRDAAPVSAPARLPVVLFAPCWDCVPWANTVLLQDLASHGFVVVAADLFDPGNYPGDAAAAADLRTPLDYASDATEAVSDAAGARNTRRQARLLAVVLDRLGRLRNGVLAGHLDLSRVAAVGYSFGGSVVVEAAADDPRIDAVVDIDGSVWTDAYRRGFTSPFLFVGEGPDAIADELASSDPITRREGRFDRNDAAGLAFFLAHRDGSVFNVDGARHEEFADGPLLREHAGERVPPSVVRARTDGAILDFLDHDLGERKGTASTRS